MVFSIQSATEVTNGQLEVTVTTKKIEIMTGQVRRQSNA
jgi:hypothetical protein